MFIPPFRYAGFWKRFNAYGIDGTIVLILSVLIGWYLPEAHAQTADELQQLNNAIAALQGNGPVDPGLQQTAQSAIMRSLTGGSLIPFVNDNLFMAISALYNIGFVAGKWQATPGKRWCGIVVVMQNGARLTLIQSAMRHALSGISILAGGLGYITMFFNPEKCALHDILCTTRVIYGKTEPAANA